nr:MAG TPA: hypothetical protein [Caudoviricetes sp.]
MLTLKFKSCDFFIFLSSLSAENIILLMYN